MARKTYRVTVGSKSVEIVAGSPRVAVNYGLQLHGLFTRPGGPPRYYPVDQQLRVGQVVNVTCQRIA